MTAAASGCHHVFVYGPPGAGKLTTAHALERLFDVRVLDNHLSVDPALRLFEFGTPEFTDVVERLRVVLLDAAGRAGLDIVTTLVYAHGVDEPHVRALTEASSAAGATVTMVQLTPSTAALRARLQAPSRQGTKKITDVALLERLLQTYDLRTPYRPDDLSIDNTDLTPDDVARTIGDHVALRPRCRP